MVKYYATTEIEGFFIINENNLEYNYLRYNKNSSNPIKEVSKDSNGQIWGYGNRIIYQLNDNSKSWEIKFTTDEQEIFGLIHINNRLKLLLVSSGLYELKFDNTQLLWKKGEKLYDNQDGQTYHIFQGSEQNVYLPSSYRELLIYNLNKDSFQLVDTLVTGSEVFSILEDFESEVIWIGTSNGLVKANSIHFDHNLVFDENSELSTAQINSITRDEKGRLWLATNKGLWSYDPITLECFQYREDDGLNKDKFNRYASLTSEDGKIWLGTSEGLVVFHPDSIQPYPHPPQLYIKDLKVNFQEYSTDIYIGEKDFLNLGVGDNTFEFDVVAMTSYLPKLNKIKYRLKGYEEEWKIMGNAGWIQYTKVPPGQYTLELKGINANGLEGKKVKTLSIDIAYPITQKLWFWLALIIISGGCVFGIARLYSRQQLKKEIEAIKQKNEIEKAIREAKFEQQQEAQKVLQEERNRISEEMHDELGGRLNSIGILVNKVKKEEEPKSNLEKIDKHANQLVENMRDIIWAMNSKYDDLA